MEKSEIESLYSQYGASLYKRALFLLRNAEEAHDILQDVFVAVVKHADSFRRESSPYTWLYRITTNLCFNRMQKNKRWDFKEIDELSLGAETSPVSRDDWEKFVKKLDDTSRKVLHYRYVDDMKQEEIAELMGMTRKTVYNYLEKIGVRYKKFLGVNS